MILTQADRSESGPLTASLLAVIRHDPSVFTQGLAAVGDVLIESSGRDGRLRKISAISGDLLHEVRQPGDHFAEGVAVVGDLVYQLTWRSKIGFVYDLRDLTVVGQFSYEGEGWGLTYDGEYLLMTDGTPTIQLRDPDDLRIVDVIHVTEGGVALRSLNDLTTVGPLILANVWRQNRLAQIDRSTGSVLGWLDLSLLRPPETRRVPDAVLNGITADKDACQIFVTGKLWPMLYRLHIECGHSHARR